MRWSMSAIGDLQLDAIRQRFIKLRPIYEHLAEEVARILRRELRSAGIPAEVKGRAKEVDSFVKKIISKAYDDPEQQVGDRAGVRVIMSFASDREAVQGIIEHLFFIRDRTDKTAQLGEKLLGYRGFHYEVLLNEEKTGALIGSLAGHGSLVCEIQLQTRAENVWNDSSHPLLYKTALKAPAPLSRRFFRLAALMELFDQELGSVREELARLPGSKVGMLLEILERHYFRLTSCAYNADLSQMILSSFLSEPHFADDPAIGDRVASFVERHESVLEELYRDHLDLTDRPILLYQPETLFLLEELEHDPFAVTDQWVKEFPFSLLENIASLWAIPLGD